MKAIGDIETKRKFTAVASGALSSGDTVCIKSDGTVAKAALPVDGSLGTFTTFESATVGTVFAAYDSNAEKVVISYQDGGNSNYGTAVVGTVSGTSITFGTPVVFFSGAIDQNYTGRTTEFDSNANKVVIAFIENGTRDGKAIVGTVSGTSISFGSNATFETDPTTNVSMTFDSSNNKIVICYQENLFTTNGTQYAKAVVGTVSGTSISFGASVRVNSITRNFQSYAAFDSTNNKVLIIFRTFDGAGALQVYVGTVSGTSISFGSGNEVGSAVNNLGTIEYDSVNNKAVVFYRDDTNSGYPTAVVGTVSGTSVSFGTSTVVQTKSIGSTYLAINFDASRGVMMTACIDTATNPDDVIINELTVSGTSVSANDGLVKEYYLFLSFAYDSVNEKTVFVARDMADNYGKAAVYIEGSGGDLTAENFIGFADAGYAIGADASVELSGSITKAQSGLTAGQKYYVQNDGSLGTTADDPSIVAGTAISATELIVKG